MFSCDGGTRPRADRDADRPDGRPASTPRRPVLGLDTETTGLDAHADRLRLIQLATPPEQVVVIDCFAVDPLLVAPVVGEGSRFIGRNLRFDLRFLLANGLPAPHGARLFDTMLGSQFLHSGLSESRGTHTLAGLADQLLALEALQMEVAATRGGATLTGVLPLEAPEFITDEGISRCLCSGDKRPPQRARHNLPLVGSTMNQPF